MTEENMTPVEGMMQFGEELINDFRELLNSEEVFEKAIQHEMQEAQEIEQGEQKEIELEKKWEGDIEEIQGDLEDIQKSIGKLSSTIKEGGAVGESVSGIFNSFNGRVMNDIEEIEGDISDIERDLDLMKGFQEEEIEDIQIEVQEFEGTYQGIVTADNEVAQIDEMADSFLNTVNAAEQGGALGGENAQRLEQMAEKISNLRNRIEQKLKELHEEQSQVQQEMLKEEQLIRKELGLEKNIMSELETEISELKKEDEELLKIEQFLNDHGESGEAGVIDNFTHELKNIEDHLANIHGHMEEIAEMAREEEKNLKEHDHQ